MKALLCILLLGGISFSAAGNVSTESLTLDFINPFLQTNSPTESLALDFFNPYIQTNSPTEALSIDWTSFGVDFPVFLDLTLSPNPVHFMSQSLSISANITSAYSQETSSVTAGITGCGDGSVVMSKQSGTCSSSCVYAGSFRPTQSGTCEVAVNATDLAGKSGYAQAFAVSSSAQYIFTGTTGPDGIAGINITALPGASSTGVISAGGTAELVPIETGASSLYMNVLVKLGSAPASNKEVSVEVV